jgi:hypothetical protein
MTFSTTIEAATVWEIVNTVANTTRTTTSFNELPSGYTPPPTNQDGTHIEKVAYTRSGQVLTTTL